MAPGLLEMMPPSMGERLVEWADVLSLVHVAEWAHVNPFELLERPFWRRMLTEARSIEIAVDQARDERRKLQQG